MRATKKQLTAQASGLNPYYTGSYSMRLHREMEDGIP